MKLPFTILEGGKLRTPRAFASSFGFTVHQVRNWEQGRNRPTGALRAYMMAIQRDPEMILQLLQGTAISKAA